MSRKWLAVAAKAAISVLLIWYLLDRVDLAKVFARVQQLDVLDAVSCLAIFVVQIGLVNARWWLVARVVDAWMRFWKALEILVIGMFFNQTLPSSVGGDAVRVWLVTRQGIPIGKAVNVVLCDRVLGLVFLVAVIGASLPALYARVGDPTTRTVLTAIVIGGGIALAILLLLGKRLADLLRRWRFTRPFGNLAADFRRLFTGRAVLPLSLLSILVHLLTISAMTLLAWGIDLRVGFLDCLVIVPTVVLITTIPISIAGWGLREGAMVAGFGFIGIAADDALALSVLFGLAQILIALPGGLVWLVDRPQGERPPTLVADS
jgi:glycosyltransferase 2 family protein